MARKVTRRAFVQAAALSGFAAAAKPAWRPRDISRPGEKTASRVAQGGKIVLRMGAQPNERFGSAVEDRPPSFA